MLLLFSERQGGSPRELQVSHPHLNPWKGFEAAKLKNNFQAYKQQVTIRSSWQGFTKKNSYLTNLMNYDEMTVLAAQEHRSIAGIVQPGGGSGGILLIHRNI